MFILLGFAFFTSQLSAESLTQLSSKPITIKVLLNEFDTDGVEEKFIVKSSQLFIKTKTKTQRLPKPYLQLLLAKNGLYGRSGKIGPFKKIKHDEIQVTSKINGITINNQPYHGLLSFHLCPKKKKLLLINTLDLEDYVYAVLRAESYQTWPHEFQKIQAIISRTYAIHQMLERRRLKNRLYDIKCNNFHQRYTGNHTFHHLRESVDETKHLIVTHNDKVVLTMFDACCGGSTPAHIRGINFKKAPYLARTTPCHFCKSYKLYKWRRTISLHTLLHALRRYKPISKKIPRNRKLLNISIANQDKAGVVHRARLHFANKNVLVSGKDIWMSMQNRLRSQNFSIKKQGNNVIFQGRGFGHQIGLCQRGARELVRKHEKYGNWPIRKILEFYYPKTSLARLKLESRHAKV